VSKQKELETQLEKTKRNLEKAVSLATEDEHGPGPDETRQSKLKKGLGTNRGIETMFRSAYRVQMELTALADNKANMMISINAIIISIILAAVAPKLDANPWLLIPTTVILLGTLVSVIFAIQAARPRLNFAPLNLQDLRHSKGNILFFGNFAKLQETEFVEGMSELILDRTLNYESMIRNIHGLGVVLLRKFSLLQKAYTLFMVAMVLGVMSFIAVFVWIGISAP